MPGPLTREACDRVIEINGVRIPAKRVLLHPRPDSTPAGQNTVPPRKYLVFPAFYERCAAKIGDEITDGSLTTAIKFIEEGPLKQNGTPKHYELRCE